MPTALLGHLLATATLSAFGFTMGLPPANEDPLMARIAPAKCVFYMSWAGTADPKPGNSNRFEQLLLDPEMVRAGKELTRLIDKSLDIALSDATERQAALARKWMSLVRQLPSQPGAIFANLELGEEGRPPKLELGFVIKVGDNPALAKELLEELIRQDPMMSLQTVMIGGSKFYRPAGNNPYVGTFGIHGSYLLLGIGEKVVEGMLERSKQEPPAWLVQVQKRLPIARRSSIAVIDLSTVGPAITHLPADQQRIFKALGLDNVVAIESVTGLDDSSVVTRTLLRTTGQPKGLFAPTVGADISAEDFSHFPPATFYAQAFKFDAPATYDLIAESIADLLPKDGSIEEVHRKVEAELGMSLRDLIAALGRGKCRFWMGAQASLVGQPPVMASIDVKDRTKIEKLVDRLVEKLSETEQGKGLMVSAEKFGDVEVKTITLPAFANQTLSWAFLRDRLVVASRKRLLREAIQPPSDHESLAQSTDLIAALKANPKAHSVSIMDPAKTYRTIYMLSEAVMPFFQSQPDFEDMSPDVLADPEKIEKHIRPTISISVVDDKGWELQTHTTTPTLTWSGAASILTALSIPAAKAARTTARQTQTSNNLRQIAIAMQNYELAKGRFPPAYSTDKNGKPLHSWRVLILPYLEQQALYNRLKLDEPWNSEHNLPILKEVVIPVYSAPGTKGKSTKTRYQGIRRAGAILAGGEGTTIADIVDGASKTLLIVETNNASGVEWFRPDDFVPDPKDPLAGLSGTWKDAFFGAFADGAVRKINDKIEPDVFDAIAGKSDGKEFADSALDPPASSSIFDPKSLPMLPEQNLIPGLKLPPIPKPFAPEKPGNFLPKPMSP